MADDRQARPVSHPNEAPEDLADLIQPDPREPFFPEEPVCRHCGQEAMCCECDGFSTSALVWPDAPRPKDN